MNQSDINDTSMDTDYNIYEVYDKIRVVSTWLIVTIGLVLTSVAIVAVSSLVKKDNVAPIYVINLLVSDVLQLCAMILVDTRRYISSSIGAFMSVFGLTASVGFMMCIALERYLAIVWPLWYRNRRTVKMSVVVCAVVWTLSLFPLSFVFIHMYYFSFVIGVFLLLPFPLLVFFLVGTIRALSASISVRAEEKRRIVGLLVLVLLIYTLLFLPIIIFALVKGARNFNLGFMSIIFIRLSPLADLFLYIFLRKGAVNQFLFWFCCYRKNRTSRQSSSGLNDGDTVTSL